MTTATIPRLSEPPADTQAPDTLADLDRELFEKARTRLGYGGVVAAERAASEERYKVSATRNLYHQLINMGVHPLDPKAVARYKAKVEAMQWAKPFAHTCVSIAFGVASTWSIVTHADPTFWPAVAAAGCIGKGVA